MHRRPRLTAAAAITCALLLLVVALYFQSWGGVALLVVGVAAVVWYRLQVARGAEDADRFFSDAGEETRLTGFQGGSPSEIAADRPAPATRNPNPPSG